MRHGMPVYILVTGLFLTGGCRSPAPAGSPFPFGDEPVGKPGTSPASEDQATHNTDRNWVNVCSINCLQTRDGEPISILLDADRYVPLHCWAFVDWGVDEPDKSCTAAARSLCNRMAHRINTREPAYDRCSVEYANCYLPEEMLACSDNT